MYLQLQIHILENDLGLMAKNVYEEEESIGNSPKCWYQMLLRRNFVRMTVHGVSGHNASPKAAFQLHVENSSKNSAQKAYFGVDRMAHIN